MSLQVERPPIHLPYPPTARDPLCSMVNAMAYIFALQDRLNSAVSPDWRSRRFNFARAASVEASEILGYAEANWAWWKPGTYAGGYTQDNMRRIHLEVIDILHFIVSGALSEIEQSEYRYLEAVTEVTKALREGINRNLKVAPTAVITRKDADKAKSPFTVEEAAETLQLQLLGLARMVPGGLTAWKRDAPHVFQLFGHLLDAVSLTFEETVMLYVAKQALNRFRWANGYKEGTYRKRWPNGEGETHEDNDELYDIVTRMNEAGDWGDHDTRLAFTLSPDFDEQLHTELTDAYAMVFVQD